MKDIHQAGLALALVLVLTDDTAAQCERQVIPSPLPTGNFGHDIAASGPTLIVGAPTTIVSGKVAGDCKVYEQIAGVWIPNGEFHPTDGLDWKHFGDRLDLRDDRALVGATTASIPGDAFVFDRIGGAWTQVARLVPAGVEVGDGFGHGLALDQGRALVGAYGDDDAGPGVGAVYVFEEIGGTWVETDKLLPSSLLVPGTFGGSISVDGDRMLVGASGSDQDGVDLGAVFVFERQGSTWVEIGTLPASGLRDESYFGGEVLLSKEHAFAWSRVDQGGEFLGRIHVFELLAGVWVEVQVLTLPNDEYPAGWRMLAAADDRLLVSAFSAQLGPGIWGAAYLFRQTPGGYVVEAELTAPGAAQFGAAVTLPDREHALVAASSANPGSVHAFDLPSFATSACLCSNGAPCGNGDDIAGCRNSTGRGARVHTCGSSSVSTDDLRLLASSLTPNQPAVLIAASQSLPPGGALPLGDGLLCGRGVAQRFATAPSGVNGELEWGPGLIGAGGSWAAGETWIFQVWYRDSAGPCGTGYNTSSAVQVRFAP